MTLENLGHKNYIFVHNFYDTICEINKEPYFN